MSMTKRLAALAIGVQITYQYIYIYIYIQVQTHTYMLFGTMFSQYLIINSIFTLMGDTRDGSYMNVPCHRI